ncbi:hypothetical protein [Sphingobacterium sp. T2]|uniref:hypothetical protein n=1 Tax=Sphingobacterium sp. T2 TaxID=1590596 RepID=UPI00057BC27D|nr:hypothetical protein [Sphingobacterium sp. T2]
MRTTIFTIILVVGCIIQAAAQSISGAYHTKINDIHHLLLFVDGYVTHTVYTDKEYHNTQGGTFNIENNTLIVHCEFDNKNPENVGKDHRFSISFQNNQLKVDEVAFDKKATHSQALDGLWRITGRKVNDNIQTMQRGNRKTLKLLIDGYFQWFAINPAEKGFYGTGGGNYTFQDGKYQENILFFSRDNSRVGVTLTFDGKIEEGQWHHSGKSSKGDPIYEIWSREK